MSSRTSSDFGTLADRSARSGQGRVSEVSPRRGVVPRHVWVRQGQSWLPGLLVAWHRQGDGTWAAEVVLSSDGPAVYLVAASLLREAGQREPDAGA